MAIYLDTAAAHSLQDAEGQLNLSHGLLDVGESLMARARQYRTGERRCLPTVEEHLGLLGALEQLALFYELAMAEVAALETEKSALLDANEELRAAMAVMTRSER